MKNIKDVFQVVWVHKFQTFHNLLKTECHFRAAKILLIPAEGTAEYLKRCYITFHIPKISKSRWMWSIYDWNVNSVSEVLSPSVTAFTCRRPWLVPRKDLKSEEIGMRLILMPHFSNWSYILKLMIASWSEIREIVFLELVPGIICILLNIQF
jgi:hypothetical protein